MIVDVGALAHDHHPPTRPRRDFSPPPLLDLRQRVHQALGEDNITVCIRVEDNISAFPTLGLGSIGNVLVHVPQDRRAVGIGRELAYGDETMRLHVYMYVCMHACMHVSIHTNMNTHTHTHTHTHANAHTNTSALAAQSSDFVNNHVCTP